MESSVPLDSRACKQIALWTWLAVGAAFIVLMYASFGWIGPAPAFLIWSAGALPLFLLTLWWRANVGLAVSRTRAALILLLWIALSAAIPLIQTPTNRVPKPVQWLLITGLVTFPVTLTWYTI